MPWPAGIIPSSTFCRKKWRVRASVGYGRAVSSSRGISGGERLEAEASADGVSGAVEAEHAGDAGEVDALALYDDNGNGRITCKEARAHGIAPVPRSMRLTRTCRMRTTMAWCMSGWDFSSSLLPRYP